MNSINPKYFTHQTATECDNKVKHREVITRKYEDPELNILS